MMEGLNHNVKKQSIVQKSAAILRTKHKVVIQKHISSIVHSCQCHDTNCKLRDCQKMRKIKQHKNHGKGCFICRKIAALSSYHAKQCSEQRNLQQQANSKKRRKNLKKTSTKKSSPQTKSQVSPQQQQLLGQTNQLSTQPSQNVTQKNLTPNQIQASLIPATKEWHNSIPFFLRNLSVYKLIQSTFPRFNPSLINDKRMSNVIEFNKKIEADIYKTSESKSEYYHSIALKIYEIQKKMEEKMQKRTEAPKISEKPKKVQLPQGFTLVQAIPVEKTKEWHQSVPLDHRNHLVYKFVQAVFPNSDPGSLKDERMSELLAFAKKVESETYETAESRPQYHYLLADKLYKIEKKFEMKRKIYKIEKELERSCNV